MTNDLAKLLSERLEQFKWKGEEWGGSLCPFPDHSDTGPSFRVNMQRGFYYCFGCQRSGSIGELLAVLGLPAASVESLLAAVKFVKELKKEEHTEILPEYILAAFRRCPKELLDAGFNKSTLKDYDIGFDLDKYCTTYPLRTVDGILSAVYRRVDGIPKYLVYTFEDFEGYKPAPKKHLWGLHKVYAKYLAGDTIDRLVVTEGFKACLWVSQFGYDAVATMGTAMTKDQVNLLAFLDLPVLLMFDNDDAGEVGTARAYKKLRSRVTDVKFCIYPKDKKQPDDLTENETKTYIENPKNFIEWRRECRISSTDLERMILTRKVTRY